MTREEAICTIENHIGGYGTPLDKALEMAIAALRQQEFVSDLEKALAKKMRELESHLKELESNDPLTIDELRPITVRIRRCRHLQYRFQIRPLRGSDIDLALKMASGKGVKNVDTTMVKNWLIYLATIKDDRVKVWGGVKDVDTKLTAGEKYRLLEAIMEISGMNEPDG